MDRIARAATAAAAIAIVALGILTLLYRDTLLGWQPAPRGAVWREPYAILSGVILLASGAAMMVPRWRPRAALIAAAWIGSWALLLHLPIVVTRRGNVGALLGLAETSFMALGLAICAGWPSRFAPALRIGLGLCMLIFGISHFVYADITASMVPRWLPQRLAIAYLTGAVHALMGMSVIVGLRVRTAATVEAAMMSSFVLLLHVPAVLAAPHDRAQRTMLAIASLLTCAAWLAAGWKPLRAEPR